MTTATRPAPRFAVGDWAFNNTGRAMHNARVVSVVWDHSLNGYRGDWRYGVPGLSDPGLYAARPDMPYVEYTEVRPGCWAQVEG